MSIGVFQLSWSAAAGRDYRVNVEASAFAGTLFLHDGPTVSDPVIHTVDRPVDGPLNLTTVFQASETALHRLLVSVEGTLSDDVVVGIMDIGRAKPITALS